MQSASYLKTVDGGFVSAAIIDEPVGAAIHRVKHTSVASIEPFSVEFGLQGSMSVLKWIQSSWNRSFSRRNGQITHADFNLNQTFIHEFSDALIMETTFPALDGGSKDPAMLKMKFQPERVNTQTQPGGTINDKHVPSKQKSWLCSGFRLNIDNVANTQYVNKIESFTIKQGVKAFYTGTDRFPQIEPTKIDFPNIVGTIAQGYADGMQAWYEQCVANGIADPKSAKQGSLEMLAPDKSTVLFRLTLKDCGLLSFKLNQSTANSGDIKRARFEMFVSEMAIDGSGSLARG
ncbi:MAG TPA: hypothetical protein VGG74_09900 [Kofleriaceae bacterium]